MQQEKIDNFYDAMHALYEKKKALAKAVYDVEDQIIIARNALNNTIDNGISCKEVEDAHSAYMQHKFSDEAVQHLISKVDALVLAGLSSTLRSNLELTAMHFSMSHASNEKICCSGPISLDFVYKVGSQSKKCFQLVVPINGTIQSSMKKWNEISAGLYCVYADYDLYSKKLFCKVFDAKKVTGAIARFLNGEFDNELMHDSYANVQYGYINVADKILEQYNNYTSALDETYWCISSAPECISNTIKSCIDDTLTIKNCI